MSKSVECALELQEEVLRAVAEGQPLNLTGGNSKAFYGRPATGTTLAVNRHCGVINYEPKELLLTARTGTPLSEIETLLAEQRQMLAFEPPILATTPRSAEPLAVDSPVRGAHMPDRHAILCLVSASSTVVVRSCALAAK